MPFFLALYQGSHAGPPFFQRVFAVHCGMGVTRNPRAGLDDRWHKRVKGPDGAIRKERSAVYGKVARWRVRWVDDTGHEQTKVFRLKETA